jgi:hypothetical protein
MAGYNCMTLPIGSVEPFITSFTPPFLHAHTFGTLAFQYMLTIANISIFGPALLS